MDKREIIIAYNALLAYLRNLSPVMAKISPYDVCVSAGAALVLMDIIETTLDIDVSISLGFWDLIDRPAESISHNGKTIWFKTITSNLDNHQQAHIKIDIHIDDIDSADIEIIDGVGVGKFDYLVAERKRLGREKDMQALNLLYQSTNQKAKFVTELKALSEKYQLDISWNGQVEWLEFEVSLKSADGVITKSQPDKTWE